MFIYFKLLEKKTTNKKKIYFFFFNKNFFISIKPSKQNLNKKN